MDEIVRQAMAKWPNVPAVYGWLSLDRRGTWLLKGERIGNPGIVEFIRRNYASDDAGCWYFQNGPQRVFVQLEYAPWALRTTPDGQLVTHTGLAVASVESIWLDEAGAIVLRTEHGAGVLDDRDADEFSARFTAPGGASLCEDALLEAVERIVAGGDGPLQFTYAGRTMPIGFLQSALAPARLGFVRDPQPPASR